MARRGEWVAAGTSAGLVVGRLDSDAAPQAFDGPTVLSVAFLDDQTLLGATLDGSVQVWRRDADTWRTAQPMALTETSPVAVATVDGRVWVADGDGVLVDLHLGAGRTAGLVDALRGGWQDWLDAQTWPGLDAVRVHARVGRSAQALRVVGSLEGPSAMIWSAALSAEADRQLKDAE